MNHYSPSVSATVKDDFSVIEPLSNYKGKEVTNLNESSDPRKKYNMSRNMPFTPMN